MPRILAFAPHRKKKVGRYLDGVFGRKEVPRMGTGGRRGGRKSRTKRTGEIEGG